MKPEQPPSAHPQPDQPEANQAKPDRRRTVFFVSDRTGLTAETYGRSLLAQFPKLEFQTVTLAFIDSPNKANLAVAQINNASAHSGQQPIVFSSLVEMANQDIINSSQAVIIDLFNTFLGPLEQALGMESAHSQGMSKNILGKSEYLLRLDAIDYSLSHDDGVRPDQYDEADVILLGVSRCGKTPTSLYLAMNFSLKVANYPLIGVDLKSSQLPKAVQAYRDRLVGLMIKPVPLSRIRLKRRPDSEYASLANCQKELEVAGQMFRNARIPVFDTTETSIEEIGSYVVQTLGISRERTGYA